MRFRFFRFLIFLLLHTGYAAMADDFSVEKELKKIDSLIFYCDFPEGAKAANSLYDWLTKNDTKKKYKEQELQLLLYKSYLYARKESVHKALETSLKIIDKAKKYKLPEKEYQACLVAATVYEQSGEFDICKSYLNKAYRLYRQYDLENVYAVYCIRLSSYYRFVKKIDSAILYAYKGLDYAKKYGNKREYIDGSLLLGGLLQAEDYQKATQYSLLAAHAFLNKNDYEGAAALYNNVAAVFLSNKETDKALRYSDSSLWVIKTYSLSEADYFLRIRYRIFDALSGYKDSAYHYFKKYHYTYVNELKKMESVEIKKVTEQYQNDKKEAALKSKNQQLVFIISLLGVITASTILIIRKNRKISYQNKVISKQVEELMRTLEQKQMLLSELQHRVKNNLQHVISILEIQKESVDFNNIDELIRGNQNRIHSMALLHKKLNISDNVHDVGLKRYITELSELVKESYDNQRKKVSLNTICEIEKISIEKALPIGLIIVELVSNSMKHAFKKQHIGIIQIAFTKDTATKEYKLYYADNGCGYDFNNTGDKGLGMEIIKGLIGQLDAIAESSGNNGFELTLSFK